MARAPGRPEDRDGAGHARYQIDALRYDNTLRYTPGSRRTVSPGPRRRERGRDLLKGVAVLPLPTTSVRGR